MQIKIKRLTDTAVIPKYQTERSAGFDLVADETAMFMPGYTRTIATGLAFEIPEGYEMQIRPRSGLSLNTPLRVANAPGTIDSDYRGEVRVIITNTSSHMLVRVNAGDRIAQGVICPIEQAEFEVVDELTNTERGTGGFGSTGGIE